MTQKKIEKKLVTSESKDSDSDDEIDLFDLIRILHRSWKLIIGSVLFCAILAFVLALMSPDVFKAEVLLVPVKDENQGIPSSMNQFGGLVALAGINIPGSSNMERVMATLQSRKFLKYHIENRNVLPQIFDKLWDKEKNEWILEPGQEEPSVDSGYSSLRSAISIEEDKQTGLITLSVSWHDPEVAAIWANDLVKQLNERLRAQAIQDSQKRVGYLQEELAETSLKNRKDVLYNLLESEEQKAMLAKVNEYFALEVFDPAVVPEVRLKPKPRFMITIGCICGFLVGVFLIFLRQFLKKYQSL